MRKGSKVTYQHFEMLGILMAKLNDAQLHVITPVILAQDSEIKSSWRLREVGQLGNMPFHQSIKCLVTFTEIIVN